VGFQVWEGMRARGYGQHAAIVERPVPFKLGRGRAEVQTHHQVRTSKAPLPGNTASRPARERWPCCINESNKPCYRQANCPGLLTAGLAVGTALGAALASVASSGSSPPAPTSTSSSTTRACIELGNFSSLPHLIKFDYHVQPL
jgi:hypothetical protein